MSEFDSTLRVALKDDSIFDAIVREAQRQGCSIRALIVNAVLGKKVVMTAEAKATQSIGPDVFNDTVSVQRIYEEMLYECQHDPDAFGRRLCESVGRDDFELSGEEARELWGDC